MDVLTFLILNINSSLSPVAIIPCDNRYDISKEAFSYLFLTGEIN
jgi:hypothetical protein